MSQLSNVSIFVVHYTKLSKRKLYLEKFFSEKEIIAKWVTEKKLEYVNRPLISESNTIFGISEKKIGMDLGVNSRSLVFSRRKARLQGYFLYLRSCVSKKENLYTTGSLPPKSPLSRAWQEVQLMHISALRQGIETRREWILVLEDDALPTALAFSIIKRITENLDAKNTWINLNSGAGLKRTKSERKIDSNGLFRVYPASTRCAVAYLISRDLAIQMSHFIEQYGLPDWLPIDLIYQALLRKSRAKAYWQDPPVFQQGSENGTYESFFELIRSEK